MRIPAGTIIHAQRLLFDMDGTLVNSTAAVERIWGRWAEKNGVALKDFVHCMHGRRAIEIMAEVAPAGLDPATEVRQIDKEELRETDGIIPIAGAAELLASLPKGSWALVTSARAPLAKARMAAAGLPMPDVVVTSNDVATGKPDPACYILAARRLGVATEHCVVFEDAPAGFAAGRAAGCRTIALATTSSSEDLGQESWLPNLEAIQLESGRDESGLLLRVL